MNKKISPLRYYREKERMKHEKTDDSGATAQPQPQRKVVRKRGGSSNDSDDEDGDARMRNHEVCEFRCEIFCLNATIDH